MNIKMLGLVFCFMLFVSGCSVTMRESIIKNDIDSIRAVVKNDAITVNTPEQSGNLLDQDIDPTIKTTNSEKSELRKIKLNESYSVEIKTTPAGSSSQNYELSIFKAKKWVYFERFEKVLDSGTVDVYPITFKGKTDNIIIISSFSGGPHCCFIYTILSLGNKIRKMVEIDARHSPLEIRDIDKDSTDDLVLCDCIFAYWHTGFAASPCPEITLKYQDGNYKPSAKLMRKPYTKKSESELWKKAREISVSLKEMSDSGFSIKKWVAAEGLDVELLAISLELSFIQESSTKTSDLEPLKKRLKDRGLSIEKLADMMPSESSDLPPELWAIMLDLLYTGNGDLALEFLEKAWYKKLKGKAVFLKSFKQQLLKSPYISVIKEMNPTFFK